MLVPTIFFAISFNLIVLTTNLILRDYLLHLGSFMLAVTAALVVGKAVLVADQMPFLHRFDTAPLIRPILFKAVVYWAFVLVARLLERVIGYLFAHGSLAGFSTYFVRQFSWNRFAAVQIWIFVLFLVYVTASELNTLFGDGELGRVLFRHQSSELKVTRRQRIRALVRLSRLTETHTPDELGDRRSPAHAELIALIRGLAKTAAATRPDLLTGRTPAASADAAIAIPQAARGSSVPGIR
jgi:hypothetical protein